MGVGFVEPRLPRPAQAFPLIGGGFEIGGRQNGQLFTGPHERIVGAGFDEALLGDTLKGIFPEVEQEMQPATTRRHNCLPVLRRIQQGGIALNHIELAPLRRQLAESALTAVPAVVIGGAETIAFTAHKAQRADFALPKLRKLKCVYQKPQHQIPVLNFDDGVRSIRLGIPAFIEFVKSRFHKLETVNAD